MQILHAAVSRQAQKDTAGHALAAGLLADYSR